MRSLVGGACVVMLLAIVAGGQQTLYHGAPLGVLPGRDSSTAGAINNRGQVTGMSCRLFTCGPKEAFLWDPASGMTGLGFLCDGCDTSIPHALNNLGWVAGDAINGQIQGEAFFWSPKTGMIGLGDLPGGSVGSGANAINDAGQVVGTSATYDFGTQGFIWDLAGGLRGMGYLPGAAYPWSIPFDIDNSGRVVGYATNAGGGDVGFIWTEQDGYMTIPVPPPWRYMTSAVLINEAGQILGGCVDSTPGIKRVLVDPVEGPIVIPPPPGGSPNTTLNGLNDHGVVTGTAYNPSDGYSYGFIWDRQNGSRWLNPLVDAATPFPLNQIRTAGAINNLGQITVSNPYGYIQGVVFTPFILADMNCDGSLNSFDIQPFVLTLQWLSGDDAARKEYEQTYPGCHGDWAADANQDGSVNQFDIQPFIDLLAG